MLNISLNRASGNLVYHVLCSEDMAQYLDDCFSSQKKLGTIIILHEVMFICELSYDI